MLILYTNDFGNVS